MNDDKITFKWAAGMNLLNTIKVILLKTMLFYIILNLKKLPYRIYCKLNHVLFQSAAFYP